MKGSVRAQIEAKGGLKQLTSAYTDTNIQQNFPFVLKHLYHTVTMPTNRNADTSAQLFKRSRGLKRTHA